MDEDARNSIYLWGVGLSVFGLLWAALHFNLFEGIPDNKWLWLLVGIVGAINIAQTLRGLWKRRAANPDNPNRHNIR